MSTLHRLRREMPAASFVYKTQAFFFILISSLLTLYSTDLHSQVRVRGYYRKDGTYVRSHQRTRPDGNPYNNYSFPGNYNPNTGEITPGDPDTYLRNYYDRRGTYSSPSLAVGKTESGTDITAFQQKLKALGLVYKPAPIDRVYDSTPRSALRRLQLDSENSNDGEMNQTTNDKLAEAFEDWFKQHFSEASANQSAFNQPPEKTLAQNSKSNIATSITRFEFEARYRQALALYEKSRYQESADQLSALLDENLHNKLADNSQYWIGECYFALGDIERSMSEFIKVFDYSDTDKYDDAYLKLGLCYSRIGNKELATLSLNELLKRFPASEYTGRARQLLSRIQ